MIKLIENIYYPESKTDEKSHVKRNYYIDNLKFILICLVVVGHFAIKMTCHAPIQSLLYFIYLFHMPCFIFVSGYLAKRINAGGKLRVDKILAMLWLYFIFKLTNALIDYAFTGELNFNFFKDTAAPWYLFALCMWYILVPVIERIKTTYLIPASVLAGLIIGCLSYIRDVFSLSRVFVFLPFFIIGFCLSEQMLTKFLNMRLRMLAFIYLSVLFAFLLIFRTKLAPVSDIIYGGSSYSNSLDELVRYGILIRLTWYILAFITAAAFMLLVPRCKIFITPFGGRTLQIYMSHIWCRDILAYIGLFELIKKSSPWLALLVLLGSIALSFLLANGLLNRVFELISLGRIIEKLTKD